MDKNEELQKWLNDDKYVQSKELETIWNMGRSGVTDFLKSRNIKPIKVFFVQRRNSVFYDKQQCINARAIYDAKKQELQKWLSDTNLVQTKELALEWGITKAGASMFVSSRNIKPIKKINAGGANNFAFYDRAECEAARPFINQPEKEVEKVEQIESLDIETRREEFEHEKNSALSDDEVKLIIGQCKDPIDKVMILSVLCFGIKTGELDLLNIDDVNGDEISLQSPSGTIKMSISRQYKESLIDLVKFYKEKGWTVNDDTALFLNQSGVRMSRQGMNTRVKNISDKINIGREFTIGALRATFAQRIYKETNKNIGSVHKYLRLNDNTSVMSYLLDFQSKEQRIMPTELMNDVSTYCDNEEQKQMELPEPKEQTPDIIPADTIDLFTMSELETELKNRGVELTTEVKAKINASDMPEMQHIATMIRGDAKTIAIRLSVLNEIARQLQDVESENDDENEEQGVFYSYHQASELLGISMGSLRNKVNAIGMTLKKNGVKAYFTANQIDSLRKQPKESDESPSARDIDDKFNTILSRLKEIEYQVVYSENFGPSEDIINHFKSAIQSRSNVLSALLSRAKIVICHESCVILLDQKFAVDKVSESKNKETINNALMDIGCKDFNIYVLFSGKHDVKNNQEN